MQVSFNSFVFVKSYSFAVQYDYTIYIVNKGDLFHTTQDKVKKTFILKVTVMSSFKMTHRCL